MKPMETISIREYSQLHEKDFIKGVISALKKGVDKFENNPFYLQVKHVKRTENGIQAKRPIMLERQSCPTPGFDEIVYKYYPKSERLELLWTLPSKKKSLDMYHNRTKVHPDQYVILDQILKYFDGTIFKIVDRMEHDDGRYVQ